MYIFTFSRNIAYLYHNTLIYCVQIENYGDRGFRLYVLFVCVSYAFDARVNKTTLHNISHYTCMLMLFSNFRIFTKLYLSQV